MTLVQAMTEVDRETRDGDIVRARLDGATYREIADQTGLSISQCHRVYEAARARRRGDLDIERHIDEQYADIEKALDIYRAQIFGEPSPPDVPMNLLPKDAHDLFWKALGAKSKLLGLDAAKRSHVVSQPVEPEPVNHQVAEFVAQLAAWARRTNAINTRGLNPALPPGMTERVTVNGHADSDGLDPGGPHDKSVWSMALENPSEE